MIIKAKLWVYDYIHLIYKGVTDHRIYNQLHYLMETHDMGKVDNKTGLVVGGEEHHEQYN